jgi:hypothetical protein
MSEDVQASAPDTNNSSAEPTEPSNKDNNGQAETTGQNTKAQDTDNAKKIAAAKELDESFDDRIVKLVIDGEPKELTVREMKKLTSLEKASQSRMQKAAEVSKKAQEFWEKMQDPDEFFKFKNMNPVEYAEMKLKKAIEEAEMSPAQRDAAQKELKLKERETQIQQFYEQRAQQEIEQGIGEAFKEANLPRSPFLMGKMAQAVLASENKAQESGQPPLSYKDAAAKVKTWFQNGIRETMTNLPPQEMISYLGPELVKKLQAQLIAQVQGPATAKGPAQAASQEQLKTKPKTKQTFRSSKEFQDYVDGL